MDTQLYNEILNARQIVHDPRSWFSCYKPVITAFSALQYTILPPPTIYSQVDNYEYELYNSSGDIIDDGIVAGATVVANSYRIQITTSPPSRSSFRFRFLDYFRGPSPWSNYRYHS